jgi:hypothetical protein
MVTFFLSTGCAKATPEQRFWIWFQSNEAALFDVEKDQPRMFDRLAAEMHKVNPSLTFEFGPKEDGRREFTISADGIREAFPKVEALYAAAPSLPRWKLIKFRQRRKASDVSYDGVSVQARTVTVQVVRDGPKVNLAVFIPGYSATAKQTYEAIAYLLLDHALGEYDVEMRVGAIDIKPISQAPANVYSLDVLPKVVDDLLGHR